MVNNRLLLVEDDFDVAEMLLMYFKALNYEVLHADTGAAGIEMARKKFPNLILLDVMLPDMDGYDICVRLRNMSLTKYIPITFLTQRDERADKVKGLLLGADDYVTKPFDIDELRLRVDGAIRRATRDNLHETRTGLPTGPLIQEEMERRKGDGVAYLRFSLNGFGAYTDVYSFMAANDVLYHAGKTIRDVVGELGTDNDFIGIDDNGEFILLTYADDVAQIEQQAQDQFAQQARTFYTFADAERGGILLEEGTDNERMVPIMTFDISHEARPDSESDSESDSED